MFTIHHSLCHIGLLSKNVTLLIAGPPMLTVTQQIPTSPQGVEEMQMSKGNKDYFFVAHPIRFYPPWNLL